MRKSLFLLSEAPGVRPYFGMYRCFSEPQLAARLIDFRAGGIAAAASR